MNQRKTIAEIARRLPHYTQRDVAEVLDVMRDLWLAELSQPGKTIALFDLGTLSVEVQAMRPSRVIRRTMTAPVDRLTRVYGRFRLSPALRHMLKEKAATEPEETRDDEPDRGLSLDL